MAFGSESMTVEETIAQATSNDEDLIEAGDTCPEDHCEEELHGLEHPRASEFDTEAAAPEEEVVCIHDGIIRAE